MSHQHVHPRKWGFLEQLVGPDQPWAIPSLIRFLRSKVTLWTICKHCKLLIRSTQTIVGLISSNSISFIWFSKKVYLVRKKTWKVFVAKRFIGSHTFWDCAPGWTWSHVACINNLDFERSQLELYFARPWYRALLLLVSFGVFEPLSYLPLFRLAWRSRGLKHLKSQACHPCYALEPLHIRQTCSELSGARNIIFSCDFHSGKWTSCGYVKDRWASKHVPNFADVAWNADEYIQSLASALEEILKWPEAVFYSVVLRRLP